MGLSKLLLKVPTNVMVPLNRRVIKYGVNHTLVANTIATTFAFWLVLIPISKFPVTFGDRCVESKSYPDYGTGKTFTVFRHKDRSFDFI